MNSLNNQTIKARKQIKLVIDRFKEQIKPEQFNNSKAVTEYDPKGHCGIICDMLVWFPKICPEAGIYWRGKSLVTTEPFLTEIAAAHAFLRVDYGVFDYLVTGNFSAIKSKYPNAPRLDGLDSTYYEVVKAWEYMADNYIAEI